LKLFTNTSPIKELSVTSVKVDGVDNEYFKR